MAEAWVKYSTPEYRNNWDRIFGKKDPAETTCPDGVHKHRVEQKEGGFTFELKCKRCGYDPMRPAIRG
jgi:hypothetical protein